MSENTPFYGCKFKSGFDDGFYVSEMTDMIGNVHRQMLNFNEQKIRECIIAMGYTPPEGAECQDAAKTLAGYQRKNTDLKRRVEKLEDRLRKKKDDFVYTYRDDI